MISSTTSKMKIIARFLTMSAWIFSSVALAKLDFRLQESPNYAILIGDGWVMSIPKTSNEQNANIVLVKNNMIYSVNRVGNKNTYYLTQNVDGFQFELYANEKLKIGLIVSELTAQQNELACPIQFQKSVDKLLQDDITEKIQESAIAEGFIDKSCGNLSGSNNIRLAKLFKKEINPKTSFLMECFNSPEIPKHFGKNPAFGNLANQAIAAYTKDVEDLNNGTKKFKMKCHEGDKAIYEPIELAISMPIKDSEIVADKCKSVSQVFAHELLHHLGLKDPDASVLDSICGNVLNVPGAKNSECKNVYSSKLTTGAGPGSVKAIQSAQTAKTKAAKKAVTEALSKEPIKVADFVPVQDADIREITNPTSPSTLEASVERVHETMSTNMKRKMAGPLNRAIAATISPARADSAVGSGSRDSISKTNVAKTRLPASAKADDNKEYVVEEYEVANILADKYNVPVETIRAAAAAPGSINPTAKTPSIAAAPKRGAGEVAATNAAPGGGEIAVSNSGGGGGSSLSAGGGVAGRSVSTGANSNSRLPASSGTTVGSDPLVQQLGQFNEVRGRRYREIQDRYDDPTFEPELRAKNIAIRYLRNNKTTTIGDTTDKRTLFLDDGTVLKKVTGAK
jgi:hypothetical protein